MDNTTAVGGGPTSTSTTTMTPGPPYRILGYTIRSRTRIYVYYLLPAVLELFCYITQFSADWAVSYQHFVNSQPEFGAATASLILVPPVLTFVFIVTSKDQWANPKYNNRFQFVGDQLLRLFLFPFYAMQRIAVRIFWSIEALFHDDDDEARMFALGKAEACSTCELYRFIQAYGQSAPQIILQLYHMLTQDLFRDFSTTSVQAVSLVFSAIDLAAITTTYHRFESQRRVGQRYYPWSPPQQLEAERRKLQQNERLRRETEQRKRDSERTISSFPESEKIMANFQMRHQSDVSGLTQNGSPQNRFSRQSSAGVDEVDVETTVLLHSPRRSHTATDDDNLSESPKMRLHSVREEMRHVDAIEMLDTVPDIPAPRPPPVPPAVPPPMNTQTSVNSEATTASNTTKAAQNKRASRTLSRVDAVRNMFIYETELYIKEHLKRPPKLLTKHVDEMELEQERRKQESAPNSPQPLLTPAEQSAAADTVDFFFPRPTKIVNGIEQDDFAGKTVSFFGWISYLIMRMLALSTFLVFYPEAFFIAVGVQYVIMLAALFLETHFKHELNRVLFYMLLAYVYIFVLLEFRVKFKHIRVWYVLYFIGCAIVENITITVIWYTHNEEDSWWFQFIFECIMWSCGMFVASLLVYYCILRPKEVTLILEDDTPQQA